jgi:molybdate transport system substrate-binding protein
MGLVKALTPDWLTQSGAGVDGQYGAVGAMKEALQAGAPCDVMVVTQSMVDALVASGDLHEPGRMVLGQVRTGVAAPVGAPRPDVATPAALAAALLGAQAIYFPDPERATAGIHFAKVLRELGLYDTLQPRFRTYPNGATAMREMAAAANPRMLGCTQVSEILYTEGVVLLAPLPEALGLATLYTAAVNAKSHDPALARQFIAYLCGTATRGARTQAGFEA